MVKALVAVALAAVCGCARPRPEPSAAYLAALREEARAAGRAQRLLAWYEGTTGERALGDGRAGENDLPLDRPLREALDRAEQRDGLDPAERLALRFLRRSLLTRAMERATSPMQDELSAAESATLSVPTFDSPIAYRNLPLLLAGEPDATRRASLFSAEAALLESRINPILERREAAAQRAARELGFADPVALAEELRGVRFAELAAEGDAYLRATDALYLRTLDRVAREELGMPRQSLRLSDLPRLWKSPRLLQHFPVEGEVPALRTFLGGLGLDLRTAAGTEVVIDDEPRPGKRPRAFVAPVDAPADVRLSVKPTGGLDDYWTLFHEAGHALHFAAATALPRELVDLGHAAPSEAFGELFRHAFADVRFLRRLRPALRGGELAAIVRRTTLVEMMLMRRYAYSKVAYEMALHGRARQAVPLRELYKQLFSRGLGIALTDEDAARFRADVDDGFTSVDYARCFALSAMLDEGLRTRFGADWTAVPAAGAFLRRELFSPGRALSAEEAAARLGFAPHLDFSWAARRAERLLREADLLEDGS